MESRQAYRKIMDAVTVTPEVERRVLAGLRTALETRQKPAYRRWQPRLAAACAALVICAAAGFPLWLDSRTPAETPPVQGTWSAQQFESTGELAEQLSYPLLLPAWLPEGYTLESARCLQGELAEICWQADGQTLAYRMAPGDGDISGDFTAYGWEEELTAGTYAVTCKGENGLVFLAVWSDGTYSFSLHASAGLSVEEVTAVIESIGT
ncbi:hypothetical protein [Pseudoflavonifractor phocaeensis]|uniref:hypothetical protein n=1 Tax=Pseudoflavonifractor phocaeensis TaxID=1870988 RepID=UPI00195F0B59|nr:hypothetical protein [Pseudoflavonifractor phocaeensis]MBM6886698.1 hypothetical protein [Pseudoflavonifractor phocaeensis]